MNIVEVQDSLKNFSQDQLISEINQPSGMVPQFLVLTELGRRNRIKQDMEGRQAQNQPTVAQEVVSAAGVPQGGIMDMARSMAPKSSIEQNDGVQMMAEGGVVKMQTAGEVPFYGLERKVFKGQEYFTDGGTVYKQYESGQLDVVRDPDVVEGILGYSPSASTEVGSISSILNADKPVGSMSNTIDPTIDRSAFSDPVLGIKPEMIAQLPDQGNPNFSSDKDTQKAVSEIAGTRGLTPTRDNYRPFLQNQPQVQELLLPTAQPTGRQSLDGSMVSTVGPTAAEIERAQKVLEMNPVTASNEDIDLLGNRLSEAKGPLPYNELPGAPTRNETLLQDLITQNQALIPGANIPRQQTFLDNQPQDAEELLSTSSSSRRRRSDQDRDSSLATSVRSFIDDFINPPTRKEKIERGALELQEKSFDQPDPVETPQQTFLDNQPQTTEELQKDLAPFLPSGSGDTPDELMVPFDNTPSKGKGGDDGGDGDDDDTGGGTKSGSALGSLESEIANMLRENEDQQEKDKYLSLAKAGLALMASDQPTFGGALGEAGMAGIEDFQASRKAYRDDKITLLDAQRKLEQARATAAAKDKSGLTGTNIVSTLNNIRNQKSKIMTKLAEITPAIDGGELTEAQKNQAEMLKREIANLTVMESTYAGMLGGIGSLGATGTFDATEE